MRHLAAQEASAIGATISWTRSNEYPKTAIIAQGHTDSTGSETHNLELSERRAKAVMNRLIARGVDAQRITAAGYGEANPVADNGTEEGRRLNRRVDLLLKAKAR